MTNTTDIRIITLRQVDGCTRYLAVTASDTAWYRSDPAVVDAIRPLGAVDAYADGTRDYGPTGPLWARVCPAAKDALRAALRR